MPDINLTILNRFRESRKVKKLFWYTLFLVNIVVIMAIWYTNSSFYILNPAGGNIWRAFGRLMGLFAEVAILLELVLIGRISVIEQTFGHDHMNKIHRWIGYSIMLFMLGHPILLTISGMMGNGVSFYQQFADYLANWEDVFAAFVSIVLFGYIVVLSLPIIRKRLRYETWYFTHLLTYLAIGLAFSHQINSGDMARGSALYYWITLNFIIFGAMIAHRFIKPLWNAWRFEFRIARVVKETTDTYSLYITGKNIEKFNYQAGQFANVTILQRGIWFTHPFSFSAEPNVECIRFTIKALGDFTKRLDEINVGTRIILDGPMGLFIDKLALREKLIFIAGGIGITPIRALIGQLLLERKDFVLLYATRSVEDIAFKKEFDELTQIHHFPVHYIVGTPISGYELGYIDREKIVRLVPDFLERDVFLCGPPAMMDATIRNLEGLGIPINNIHFEKFSF